MQFIPICLARFSKLLPMGPCALTPNVRWLKKTVRWQAILSLYVLLLTLSCSAVCVASVAPRSWFDLSRWRDPQTWPFIPVPEIATDPNGGTTVGLLPMWLFTDDQQQISQIFAPDLTHNGAVGIGGTLRYFSYRLRIHNGTLLSAARRRSSVT